MGNCWTELAEWEQMNHEVLIPPKVVKREAEKVEILKRYEHYGAYQARFGDTETVVDALDQVEDEEPGALLRPESKLQQGMFNWPLQAFSADKNCVQAKFQGRPHKMLAAGHAAVDFTLKDTKGRPVRLADLLRKENRPVVLTTAQSSCPHFQGSAEAMNELAKRFGHLATFVCVNTIQPFPAHPDPSYETGRTWETRHSRAAGPQARDYAERVQLARAVQRMLPRWRVLVDELPTQGQEQVRTNPWWSTYGPSPRAAYVVDRSGLLAASQLLFHEEPLADALTALAQIQGLGRPLDASDTNEKSFIQRALGHIRTQSSTGDGSMIGSKRATSDNGDEASSSYGGTTPKPVEQDTNFILKKTPRGEPAVAPTPTGAETLSTGLTPTEGLV